MNKRLISGLLSAVMAINVITILPANAFALETESKVYEKDGYTVTYQIGSEWDGNRSVEVSIKNTGEESILNWALKYDVGGEVYNLWNSKVYDSSEEYTIIKNNGYNYEIEPGQSANYGYIVKGEETVIPEDIELCSRRIDVKSGYEIDFNVTSDWYTGFNGEISITNVSDEPIEAWTLSFDSNFDINNIWNAKLLTSENRSYEAANQLWTTPIKAGESASFGFSAEKSATENANAENFVLTAVVVGRSALEYPDFDDIDYELDSDSDGLPDYYEDILGTDKNNPDTDGDGLTDGYEVFYLGTDPLKADSDDNGVNDGDEDPDNDGLSNLKECELGTDPNNSDTDGDGLTDGAEVNIHKTDPLKYDTDEDGISDGDEIALGLDPNSGSTNGTPDSERTFTQTVSADSEALSAINECEDTPFKVSLEMKAAGVAEKNLSAYESGYSAVMQNDAVIGIIPQFNYGSGLSVEEVTVKFELNESIVNNTLGTYAENGNEFEGIKRLNIFKYFEDINMLLPVETFHDTDKNVVYTTTDCLGTYCLIDMEVWLDSLGISSTFGKTEVEESGAMSENSVDNDNYMCYTVNELEAKSNDSKYKDNLNVVFVIDTRIASDKLEETKEKILDISRTVLKHSPDSRIYIFEQNTDMSTDKGYKVYSAKGNRFFTDYNTLAETLKEGASSGTTEDSAVLSDAVGGIISVCDLSRETYAFSLFSQEGVIYRTENGYDFLDSAIGKNVDISVIAKIDDSLVYGYAHDMYKKSGGIILSDTEDYTEDVLNHIYGKKVNKEEEDTGKYQMILATGLRTVELKAPITEEYAQLAKLDEIDETQPDTDEDGLPDYKEINFSVKGADGKPLIEFVNGVVDLPTYGECVAVKSELTYVERGFNRFDDVVINDNAFLNYVYGTVYVLPIVSDPTSEDGDGDGLLDGSNYVFHSRVIAPCDPNPLCVDGKAGSWLAHIENAKRDDIQHNLGDWYGYTSGYTSEAEKLVSKALEKFIYSKADAALNKTSNLLLIIDAAVLLAEKQSGVNLIDSKTFVALKEAFDLDNYIDINGENSGVEGIYAVIKELVYLRNEGILVISEYELNIIVICAVISIKAYLSGYITGYESLQCVMNCFKSYIMIDDEAEKNKIMASLGSRFLNFKADTSKQNIHSQHYSWQGMGGYNNLYDRVFGEFTDNNMDQLKLPFAYGDTEYILWLWRGDYLNLGAGAEIGIYSRPQALHQDPEKLDHYFVDYNLQKQMKLYLYEENGGMDYTNVFSWEPYEYQWWITGFNPQYVDKVNMKRLISIGCVDFTGYDELFEELRVQTIPNNNDFFVAFDNETKTVWINWCYLGGK